MGFRLPILLISLAVNVALAMVVLRDRRPVLLFPSTTPQLQTAEDPTLARPGRVPPSSVAQDKTGTSEAAAQAFTWAQLESEDYREYIARLRGFGVLERTIRDLIIADVSKLYRPRLAALRPPTAALTNFWEQRGGYPSPRVPTEQREQLRALEKEKTELIKSLLGKDVYQDMARETGEKDWTERAFGNLAPDQRDKVAQMHEQFQQINSEIYAKAEGHVDQETQADLKKARRKFLGELATVLTPEQVEEFQLRSSDIASNMRYQLRTFEPSEEEFRAVFKYKQAKEDFDLDRSAADPASRPSPEEVKARQQKQKEMEDQLTQMLGPDRAKELRLSENYEFQNLLEAGVPKENVFKVADMKQDVEAAARKIREDKSLTGEQRTVALATIRAESEAAMTELLGERRARGYISNGGYWLRNVAPRQ